MSYPGTLKLKIYGIRDVRAVDLNGKSDPYVVIKVGKQRKQTKTIKNTLNPDYNEGFYLLNNSDVYLYQLKLKNLYLTTTQKWMLERLIWTYMIRIL